MARALVADPGGAGTEKDPAAPKPTDALRWFEFWIAAEPGQLRELTARAAIEAQRQAALRDAERLRTGGGMKIQPLSGMIASAEPPKTRLHPDVPSIAIDDERVADCALPTVFDYVECVKAMSSGGDVMALLAERGMDLGAWAKAGGEWGRVMTARPDVAMRCGALLGASWR